MCVCVCIACLCACSAVHALQRGWGEMRDETGEYRRLQAELSPLFIPACSVTSALWHVAVLNHRAIIWCQVVQRPQTSVMELPCCTVSVSLSSMQLFTATLPQVSTASFSHSFSSCQPHLYVTNCFVFACIMFTSFTITVRAGF